ncbi:hypothetical protein [Bosea sp. BK604]|uniref:hypothetical protein n=1 Tax=Bosea sp. BK604 TaxID=2512180 RepID=UPI0010483D97|nr:hypothetical protein [Bosea sp. BK604]TCR70487.1 hypothetical protein EV560_101894 [Bosea sp. BK604]
MSKAGNKKLVRETVRHLTYFVVQAFREVKGAKGKITADDPIPAQDEAHAKRLFERYLPIRAGVVAFRRTGDPTTGDWEDAVIIHRHGRLPAEVDNMADANDLEADNWALSAVDLKVA